MSRRSYNIAMVSDFFYPNPGGVESHIYQLSSKLVDRGHKVVIIVHANQNGPSWAGSQRQGVRYLTNGIKVYHVPAAVLVREATFPTVFGFFPLFRNIVIRERIEIVHGHASLSNLCHEGILHARTMGIRALFTDHSLFGFADAGGIFTNKLLKYTLSDVDHVICVSHTCKENTVLRAALDPSLVSVIPNAVVAENFRPLGYGKNSAEKKRPPVGKDGMITIVVISRLFYNKGIDLLIAAIPRILEHNPTNVRFVIAGSGPKAIDLEQMIEQNVLQDRVELVGPVRHEMVRDVMVRGDIYLHPALTEAFGTVLVEAASCGLYVVTTKVGGIPEVLPSHMTVFARPEEEDLVSATNVAIADLRAGRVRPELFHDEIKEVYSWKDVARRTERVYDSIMGEGPSPKGWEVDEYGVEEPRTPPLDGLGSTGVELDVVGSYTGPRRRQPRTSRRRSRRSKRRVRAFQAPSSATRNRSVGSGGSETELTQTDSQLDVSTDHATDDNYGCGGGAECECGGEGGSLCGDETDQGVLESVVPFLEAAAVQQQQQQHQQQQQQYRAPQPPRGQRQRSRRAIQQSRRTGTATAAATAGPGGGGGSSGIVTASPIDPPPTAAAAATVQRGFFLSDRLRRYYGCGVWAGKLFCAFVVVDYLVFLFLELWFPRSEIDICPDWPRKQRPASPAPAPVPAPVPAAPEPALAARAGGAAGAQKQQQQNHRYRDPQAGTDENEGGSGMGWDRRERDDKPTAPDAPLRAFEERPVGLGV